VQLKYKNEVLNIGQDMWDAMNKHAHERGMTIDEYIAEAFTKLKETEQMQDNLEPIIHPNDKSCGGVPTGWIPSTEYDESDDLEMIKSMEQDNDKTDI